MYKGRKDNKEKQSALPLTQCEIKPSQLDINVNVKITSSFFFFNISLHRAKLKLNWSSVKVNTSIKRRDLGHPKPMANISIRTRMSSRLEYWLTTLVSNSDFRWFI